MADGILALSPLSYWAFPETTGTSANNAVTAGLKATLQNGAAFIAGGVQGRGVSLDGVNDLVSVAHAAAYALNSGAISLWFKPDALGRDQGLISKNSEGLDAGGGFSVILKANGTLVFQLESASASFTIQSSTIAAAGGWNNVVVSWGAGGMQLWLNGSLIGSNAYAGGLGTSSGGTGADDPLVFGANTQNAGDGSLVGASDFFKGALDEAAVLSRQPSAAEIAAIYLNGSVQNNANPVANPDALSILENATGPFTGNVLSNDSDPNADPLAVFAVKGDTSLVGTAITGVYGVLTLGANGAYSYALNSTAANVEALKQGQVVTDTFAYTASDGRGGLSTSSLVVTITGQNDAPVVVGEARTITEDPTTASLTGNVLTNDKDLDGGVLVVAAVNGAANGVGATLNGAYGAMTIAANGAYTYTLANTSAAVQGLKAGQSVTDTFTYAVSDGQGGTSTTSIVVTVTGKNDVPTIVANTAAITANAAPSVSGNVLTNDSDVDGDALVVSAVKGAAANVGLSIAGTYGSLKVNADGSYVYTLANTSTAVTALAAGQTATDTFAYTASDGNGGTGTANLVVTVTGVNDAPTALNDALAITEDPTSASLTGNALTNDKDPDGGVLAITAVNGQASNVGQSVAGTYGALTLGANGAYTYTLANASAAVQGLKQGQVVTDTFSYLLSDGQGGSATANVVVTVTGKNDGPTIVADAGAVTAGTSPATSGNVLANDSDIDGDLLVVSAVKGVATNVDKDIVGTYGTLHLKGDGSYTYALNPASAALQAMAPGSTATDTFAYTAKDPNNASASANLVITVTGGNTPPVAVNDARTIAEDASPLTLTGSVLTNDSDVNGGVLSVIGVAAPTGNVGATVQGVYGSLNIGTNGAYTYTLANASTAVQSLKQGQSVTDTFSYTISDGQGGTATANVVVTVTGKNDAPTVVIDTGAVTAGSAPSTTGNALANDSDIEGDAISVSAVKGVAANVGANVAGTYGVLKLNADGGYTYTLTPTSTALIALAAGATATETFAYTAKDALGATASSSLVFTVTGANDPPTAVNDARAIAEDTATPTLTGNVLANDTDPDGGTLQLATVAGSAANIAQPQTGAYGSLIINADGSYSYTLNNASAAVQSLRNGQSVTDTFAYGVSDGQGASASANVVITVTGKNDAPTVTAVATAAVKEDVTLTAAGSVLSVARDVDTGDTLSVNLVNGAAANVGVAVTGVYGSLKLNTDGSYVYTLNNAAANVQALNAGQTVTDTFTYRLVDGSGATVTNSLVVSVAGTAENRPPVAVNDTLSGTEDTVATFDVRANDSDPDGNPLTITQIAGQAIAAGQTVMLAGGHGVVLNANGTLSLTPAANFNGPVTFAYTISDGQGATAIANATVAFVAVNDAPTAQNDAATTAEGTPVTITVLANDTDIDGDSLSVSQIGGQAIAAGQTVTLTDGAHATLNANGTITYAPAPNINGAASFAYTLSDGHGGSATANANVMVTPVAAPAVIDFSAYAGLTSLDASEVKVNSTPTFGNNYHESSVSALADGGYVVTWSKPQSDGNVGIYSQRFDAAGAAAGSETHVNTYADLLQIQPTAAGLSGGGYVIVWSSYVQDGSESGVYMQRYTAAGVREGGETRVNTATAGSQDFPTVTALPDGGYLVGWRTRQADVQFQRYDANGVTVGGQPTIPAALTSGDQAPHFALLTNGALVSVWDSDQREGADNSGVYMRLFNSSLSPASGDLHVNSTTNGQQVDSAVAALAGGGFVVTWTSYGQDGSEGGIYAQRYDNSAAKVGAEFRINTTIAGNQFYPNIVGLPDGGFVVTWSLFQNGGGERAQRFDANGAAVGFEFSTAGSGYHNNESNPAIAVTSGGVFVQTVTTNTDVFVHRFDTAAPFAGREDSPVALPISVGAAAGDTLAQVVISGLPGGSHLSAGMSNSDGTAWTFSGAPPVNLSLTPPSNYNGAFTLTVTATTQDGGETTTVAASRGVTIAPAAAAPTVNFHPGATAAGEPAPIQTTDVLVNVSAAHDASTASIVKIVGGFAVVMTQGGSASDIFVQRFSDDGAPLGTSVRANTYTSGKQWAGSAAGLADGSLLVTWTSDDQDGSGRGIFAQHISASGVAIGSEFQVNTYASSNQQYSCALPLADGGYVVSWWSINNNIYSQRFAVDGSRIGIETQINTSAAGETTPKFAALNDGGYVVSWWSPGQSGYDIFAQRFNASGTAVGGELHVNTTLSGDQYWANVVGLSGGGFVVTWGSAGQDGDGYGVYAQRFDAAGAPAGSEFLVNTFTSGNQTQPNIVALDDGGFIVTWTSVGEDGSSSGLYGQRYTATGAAVGGEVLLNATTPAAQYADTNGGGPQVLVTPDGVLTQVFIGDAFAGGELGNVYFRQFDTKPAFQGVAGLAINLPITVAIAEAGETITQVVLSGLPAGSHLSAGSSNTDGSVWTFASAPPSNLNLVTPAGFSGTFTLTVTATETDGASAATTSASHSVLVAASNHAPSVSNDTATTPEGTSVTIDVLANDTDIDGDSLSVSQIGGQAVSAGQTVTLTGGANATLNANGTITYAPAPAFHGAASFAYTVSDGHGGAASASANVTVTPVAAAASIAFGDGGLTPVDDADVRVNTTTAGPQSQSAVTSLADGGYVVAWTTATDSTIGDIYMQRYRADGSTNGGETRVNASGAGTTLNNFAGVATLADGSFVITWSIYTGASTSYDVLGRHFKADGTPYSGNGEFSIVNAGTPGVQCCSSVAPLADGGFVVTWITGGPAYNIESQRYDASNARVGSVQSVTQGSANSNFPDVTGLADGGYVVVWAASPSGSAAGTGSGDWDVYARRYDASGQPTSGAFLIPTTNFDSQTMPSVAALSGGGFVATWSSYQQEGVGAADDIYMQRFNSAGAPVGSESRVNLNTANESGYSTVQALPDGGYVVTWFASTSTDNSGNANGSEDMFAQRFSADGQKVGGPVPVNATTAGTQWAETWRSDPAFSVTKDGVLVHTFYGDGDVYIRRFETHSVFTGFEHQSIALPIDATPASGDSISQVVLSGLPAGSVLSAGVSNADGTAWTFAGPPPANLKLTTPGAYNGSFSLHVNVTTIDGGASATASADHLVTVTPVAAPAGIAFGDGFVGGAITRTSTSTAGVQGNAVSVDFRLSADGKHALIGSQATNLVPNDTNNANDVYDKNLETGELKLVSASASGTIGNGLSFWGVYSPDATKVAFASYATNLVPNDTNNNTDIFLKDLTTGAVSLVSTTASGQQTNSFSYIPIFSNDGSKVVFYSYGVGLVPGDISGVADVFVKNLAAGGIVWVSTTAGGVGGNGNSLNPQISADGTKVSFLSDASNLVAGDTNGTFDLFVKDLTSGAITRVSTDASSGQANATSYNVNVIADSTGIFSPDGTKIAFYSFASNLVSGDTNGVADAFVKDLTTGAITRVSTDANGLQGNGMSARPTFTADGNHIIFQSDSSNLVAGDTNGATDFFVKDLATGAISRLSLAADGSQANGFTAGAYTTDNAHLEFYSAATNLIPGDTNGVPDAFVMDIAQAWTGVGGKSIGLPIILSASAGDSIDQVVLSGLPAGSILSGGVPNADGTVWTFSSAPQPNLRLTTPSTYSGAFSLHVAVTTLDGAASTTTSADHLVSVASAAHPPVAGNDTASTNEDTPVTIIVLANDSDPDGDPLSVVQIAGQNTVVGQAVALAGGASATLNANGAITYSPAANANGPASFGYTISDGHGGTGSANVNVAIAPINDAPTLINPISPQSAIEDSAFSYTFPSNVFSDVDGDALTYTATLQGGAPLPSWLVFNPATRTLTGTPLNADVGAMSIAITANDGNGGISATVFALNVANTNDAPTGIGLSNSTAPENVPGVVVGLLAAVDPDISDTHSYSIRPDGDGALFAISGNQLVVGSAPLDYEAAPTRTVTVRATDAAGAFVDSQFVISVVDHQETTLSLTSGTDTLLPSGGDATVYATPGTLNAGDSLEGGDGYDGLDLFGNATYDLNAVGQFSGFEEVRLFADASNNSQYGITLKLRDNADPSAVTTIYGSDKSEFFVLSTGSEVIHAGAGDDEFQLSSPSQLNGGDLLDGGAGSRDWLVPTTNMDLTALDLSKLVSIESLRAGPNLIVNQAVLSFFHNEIYGGGSLTSGEAALDLRGINLGNFSGTLSSSNAAGTTFTVGDYGLATHILGGAGQDTIIANGFTFTADQRTNFFATHAVVEKIVDASGEYVAPTDVVRLTSSSDVVAADSGDVTVYALPGTLNAGDSLEGGGGYDALDLFGNGSYDLNAVAQFSGFEEVRLFADTSNNSQYGITVKLRDNADPSAVTTVYGSDKSEFFVLSTGSEVIHAGGGDDEFQINSVSKLSAGDLLDGGAGGRDWLTPTTNLDLTALDLSRIVNVESLHTGPNLTVNQAVLSFFHSEIYGGGALTTNETGLDLRGINFNNFNGTFASTNAGGTTFTADSLDSRIVGGPGQDIIIASSTSFTAEQKTNFFATHAAVEKIIDASGEYVAPTDVTRLTSGTDTLLPSGGDATVYATPGTLNAGDSLEGGDGYDGLDLFGNATYDLNAVGQFSGFEEVRLFADASNNSQYGITLKLRDNADPSAVTTIYGSDKSEFFVLSTGSEVIHAGAGDDEFQLSSPSQLNGGDLLDGGAGSRDWLVPTTNMDLTALDLSKLVSIESLRAGPNLIVNQAVLSFFHNEIYGGGSLTSGEAALDLRGINLGNFSGTLSSSNAAGTTFTVGDYGLATHILGGAGQDTIIANGFTFTADQRTALFVSRPLIEYLQDSSGMYGRAPPIVLDLDGDGVHFIRGVAFDFDNDDVKDTGSWLAGGDAFLALDRNHDGAITSLSEIAFTQDKPGAATDLAGLTAFDSNNDGQLSALDARFGEFLVWEDANADGVSQPNELRTLAAAGVASIGLSSTGPASADAYGNIIHGVADVTLTSGAHVTAADVSLAYTQTAKALDQGFGHELIGREMESTRPDHLEVQADPDTPPADLDTLLQAWRHPHEASDPAYVHDAAMI